MRKIFLMGLAVLACASMASASVLFSEDFETGLDGWTSNTGSITGSYVWGTPHTAPDPVVGGTRGTTFIHEKYATAPNNFTYQIHHGITPDADATKLIFSADVYTNNASVRSFAGFMDKSGTALVANSQLARMGFNSSSSYVSHYIPAGGLTAGTVAGAPAGTGWHTINITFDLANKEITFKYDNTTYGPYSNTNITKFPNAVFLGYNSGTGSNVYWDNVVVEQVPEPATVAFLGLSGLLMFRRRRA